jgi:hypothetical protein
VRQPRRFGLVFQIDPVLCGTAAQQQAVRDALHPSFGSKFHALILRFAIAYKKKGRHYVNIEIKDFADWHGLAIAGAASIALSDKLAVTAIKDLVRHEFGHVIDNNDFITQAQREWFMKQIGDGSDTNWNSHRETWADAVRDWVNTDGEAWPSLTPILTREFT